jgi:hypothetical protein
MTLVTAHFTMSHNKQKTIYPKRTVVQQYFDKADSDM